MQKLTKKGTSPCPLFYMHENNDKYFICRRYYILNSEHPKIFISYSWEDDEHKDWVRNLAARLIADGIDATLDQYDLELGDRLPEFMEQAIAGADYVLIVCTPKYKSKSDGRKGGVGYEGHIISGELFTKKNERKFIPLIRKGTALTAIPTFLLGKLGIDLTDEKRYEDSYKDLVTTLYHVKLKPNIGSNPSYIQKSQLIIQKPKVDDEPLHILGIITDEVTVPKMDGSRGCALYKIPFLLSKEPSVLWRQIFVETWNRPPEFSSMHRPGIASTYGKKILLDGTTIEEVRDYHRKTLLLCVEVANQKETEITRQLEMKKEREEKLRNQHFNNVSSIADKIEF